MIGVGKDEGMPFGAFSAPAKGPGDVRRCRQTSVTGVVMVRRALRRLAEAFAGARVPGSSGLDVDRRPIERFHARVAKDVHHFGGDEDTRAGAEYAVAFIRRSKLAKPFPP